MTPVCPLAYRICEVYGFVPNISGKPITAPYNRGYSVETYERNLSAKSAAKAKMNEDALRRKRQRYLVHYAAEIEAEQERVKAEKLAVINSMITNRPGLTLECIIGLVCQRFDVAPFDVLSRARSAKEVTPRQAIVYLARKHLKMSFPVIGRVLRRDHSTVIHAYSKSLESMAFDKSFAAAVRDVEESMKGEASQ